MANRRDILLGGLGFLGGLATRFIHGVGGTGPEQAADADKTAPAQTTDRWCQPNPCSNTAVLFPYDEFDFDGAHFKPSPLSPSQATSPDYYRFSNVHNPSDFECKSLEVWDTSKITDLTGFGVPQRYDWPDVTPEVEPKRDITVEFSNSNFSLLVPCDGTEQDFVKMKNCWENYCNLEPSDTTKYIPFFDEPFYSRRSQHLNLLPLSVYDGI